MYKRVVIPLDGSKTAEGILPFLMEIAGPLDVEVVLLNVLEPIPPEVVEGTPIVIEDVEARRAETDAYLRGLADTLAKRGVRVRTAVRRGGVVSEILAGTREVGADLIAMTTHGRTGLSRVLFGSVAEAVLRHASVPVFLMRQADADVAAVKGAGR